MNTNFNLLIGMSSKLAFGDPELMRTGAPNIFSPFPRMLPPSPDGTNMLWKINFVRDDFLFSDRNVNPKVIEVINWHKFEIGVPFLLVGTKIVKAQIDLTINDTPTNIMIGSATVRDPKYFHEFWDHLTNGTAIFFETNGWSWFSR